MKSLCLIELSFIFVKRVLFLEDNENLTPFDPQMKIHIIDTGNFKLDGGAMFGVVPKVLWQRTNPVDQNNLIDLASKALLIEKSDQLILIDTGLGNKQSESFFKHYYRWEIPH